MPLLALCRSARLGMRAGREREDLAVAESRRKANGMDRNNPAKAGSGPGRITAKMRLPRPPLPLGRFDHQSPEYRLVVRWLECAGAAASVFAASEGASPIRQLAARRELLSPASLAISRKARGEHSSYPGSAGSKYLALLLAVVLAGAIVYIFLVKAPLIADAQKRAWRVNLATNESSRT
jgi:hypothetical protein